MSSYPTHMLIGAAGGLALDRLSVIEPLMSQAGAGMDGTDGTAGAGYRVAALTLASALLATWPDIDEPGAFISRRVRTVVSLITAVVLALVGWGVAAAGLLENRSLGGVGSMHPLAQQLAASSIGLLLGLIVGSWLGLFVLKSIRSAAGGHRRLTHSLVLAGALAGGAALLWEPLALPWLALLPAALAWGLVLHDIGDIVTPSGVPLLWPLSGQSIRVLPRPLSNVGEGVVGLTAAILVFWLIVKL